MGRIPTNREFSAWFISLDTLSQNGAASRFIESEQLRDGCKRLSELMSHLALSPGGTVDVSHGDQSDHEMPGMWENADVYQERHGTEPTDEPLTPQLVSDMLSLVCVARTPEQVSQWSADQQEQAARWAGLTHLSASDNIVDVPPKPEFLED
jgi:hypothetical protein